jgi:uncharacterized protein (TIGR03086 family)
MTEPELFILADRTLEGVFKRIKPEQWSLKVPAAIAARQPGISLRELVNYHAYDEAWVPDVLAGKTIAEVGVKYDGDLLGDDPAAAYSDLADNAVAAAEAADMTANVHLSYGDYPAGEYLKHISSFRGFRAYDVAKFVGLDPTLPPELVKGMWDLLSPDMEEWRKIGVYGQAVSVPQDADLQSKLLGLSGRDPRA